MSHSPKVSIVVPIYNVEPYLRKCLDSLVNQTLKDIEIICINDCSLDNSLAVIKEYTEIDDRIRMIDFEKNQGVSVARNAGIKTAKGEYIGTIDPDDYVDLDYYEKLYLKAVNTKADVVHANFKISEFDSSKEYVHLAKREKNGKIYSLPSHCLAIYRMDFLRKYSLKYPEGIKLTEDIVFQVEALFFANKIESVSDVYYHYVKRKGSASAYIGVEVHESFGMPLVFDFINKTIKDKEEYGHFFGHFFGHLFALFTRVAPEWRKVFVQDMVEIYKKCKYPMFWARKPDFIEDCDWENADILFEKINDNIGLLQYPEIRIDNLQNRKLYIWGAGADGVKVLIQCDNNGWKVEAFLDSDRDLIEFNGYKVISPQEILSGNGSNYFIIISSKIYASEIARICEQAMLKESVNFWKPI